MKRWFINLPQSMRMLLVLIIYAAIFLGHVTIVNLYVRKYSDKVDSKEVVVTTREIPIHTVIETEDVTIKRIRVSDLVGGALSEPGLVIGKETQAPIAKNEQFSSDKINTLIRKEGEMIIEIPSEWILSFPKSLRRLDKITFLPVIDTAKNQKVDFTAMTTQQANSIQASGTVTSGVIREDPNTELLTQSKDVLVGMTVAYFKDNSANEIIDATQIKTNAITSPDPVPRINSSNLGSRLEVAMNNQQWSMLNQLAQHNYKFVISYQ